MKNLMKIIGLLLITLSLSFTNPNKKTVIIDVGHGGHDIGNISNGLTEKEIVLSLAHEIMNLSQNDDIEIILTRSTDEFLSLEDRVNFINSLDADFLISLHSNAHQNSNKSGIELFVSNEGEMANQSSDLAQKFKNALSNNFSVADIKNANFSILKNTNYPAVMIEIGFLTNETDRNMLSTEKGRDLIATTIVQVLKK